MSEINLKNYSEIEWGERVGQYEGVGISKISGGNGGVNEWESTLGKQDGVDNYGNKVISYPEELGQIGANERLQNYVFFDIYDTGGEKLTTEKNNKDLVNLEELAEIAGKPFQTLLGIQGATGATGGGAGDVQASTTSNEDILNTGAVGALLGLIGTGTFSGAAAGFFAAFGVQEYGGKFLANVIRNKKEFFNQGYVDDLIEGKTLESFNSAALGLSNRTQRIGLSIALPMPAQINTNYGLEYEEPDFNGMGTMMAGIRAAGENTPNVGDVNSELRRKIGSVNFSVLDSLGKIVGSDGINFNQYAQASLREAPNRFSEKTFKGVERRKFNFEWDFSPRSVKDAKTIASIIYAFKKYSHPKLTKGGLYLDYPAQFRIGFFNKLQENDYLFKIGLCACTKCDITYGGDELGFLREIRSVNGQNSDFAVGAPANTVKMELEFSELELLTRQRIQTGY